MVEYIANLTPNPLDVVSSITHNVWGTAMQGYPLNLIVHQPYYQLDRLMRKICNSSTYALQWSYVYFALAHHVLKVFTSFEKGK